MKNLLTLAILFTGIFMNAQSDKIHKHNGQIISGKIIKIEKNTIVFIYDNESSEQIIGKYAVEKITHGSSGREEEISEKIVVSTSQDWEKVVVLYEKPYVAGLKKGEAIKGKISFINFHSEDSGFKKAEKKLKMEAAKKGYPFVLYSEEEIDYSKINALDKPKIEKKGVMYTY
jgi:hypothetical protein